MDFQEWPGLSGVSYSYAVYPFGQTFEAVAGNYILCRLEDAGWRPLYVGEAENLSGRCCDGHEKWAEARRMGATHIHAKHTPGGLQSRLNEETDLRRKWSPPLNKQ